MSRLPADNFSLGHSLGCGQVFGWKQQEEWWHGVIGEKPVKIRQEFVPLSSSEYSLLPAKFRVSSSSSFLEYYGVSQRELEQYFSLDHDFEFIQPLITSSGRDEILAKAVSLFSGLRLIRQNPWECAVSFICSANANIPRIEKMLQNLRQRFGTRLEPAFPSDFAHYSFPTPQKLAKATEKELRGCNLGFRAGYVKEFAKAVASKKLDFAEISQLPFSVARQNLIEQKGIGEKVADCILLFSLGHYEAFPVDVWIRRAVTCLYKDELKQFAGKKKISDDLIRSFAASKWNGFAGYAQQFLYLYARENRNCLV